LRMDEDVHFHERRIHPGHMLQFPPIGINWNCNNKMDTQLRLCDLSFRRELNRRQVTVR
jgi:hypothetical protein